MKIASLPLTTKLAAIHVLLVLSLVPLVGVAWWHLLSHDDETHGTHLAQAQHLTRNVITLNNALHTDFLAALLSADAPAAQRETLRRSMREHMRDLHADLRTMEAFPFEKELRQSFDSASGALLEYSEFGEEMVTLALGDPKAARTRQSQLDAAFEASLQKLAALANTLAKHSEDEGHDAHRATENARRWLLLAAFLTLIGSGLAVALIARSIRSSLMRVRDVAQAVAEGDLKRRSDDRGHDEVGQIAGSVNRMADALSQMIDRTRAEADRSVFSTKLTKALDMADSEQQACTVVARAMGQISSQHSMELLLSDSSNAHLERAAVHPELGSPGCLVGSPFACTAVRRGHSVSFENSDALDACLNLQGRPQGQVSATCVPITFMGRALGVLHALGPVSEPIPELAREQLNTLGLQVGARIGTVRAFDSSQRQAHTDSLTGATNRRAAENRLRELVRAREPFALVMADLDHFKLLNDTHGHQAGDDALRLFTDVVRECARQTDLSCRWGGEEFAFVLVGSDMHQAEQWVNRVRHRLVDALSRRGLPAFTASFGIVDSSHSPALDEMITAADMALYKAKREGRDRACCAQPSDPRVQMETVRHHEHGAEMNPALLAQ